MFQETVLIHLAADTESDTIRAMLRHIAIVPVWCNFSLQGQKGKQKFVGTVIYKIMQRMYALSFLCHLIINLNITYHA